MVLGEGVLVRRVHGARAVRTDPLLVVACAAVLGGLFVAAPLAVAIAAASAAALLGRRVSPRARVLSVLALAVGAARAGIAVPVYELEREAVRDALGAPRRCAGQGVIETSPVVRDGALSFIASFERLECEERRLGRVRVRIRGGEGALARGDHIEIVAQLAMVDLLRNAGLPDPTPRAARSGVHLSGTALVVDVAHRSRGPLAWIDRARWVVRGRIEATFAPQAAPLARALVLGENDLTEDDDVAFRASGLSHLLAVSGTHLVFAVLSLVSALGFVLARVEPLAARYDVGRLGAAFGFVLAPLYADFAGGSGSAWRAALMVMAGLGARAAGRRSTGSRAFGISMGGGAALDPLVGFDISFLLSAAATAGLIALGQPASRWLVPEGSGLVRRVLLGSIVATLSSMLPCAPLLALLGPSLTLAGILANVVAGPFGEVVSLPLCLTHAVVPTGVLSSGIALVASGALLVVRAIAHASAAATWLAIPVPPPGAWHLLVLGIGGLGAFVVGARPWIELRGGAVRGASTPDRQTLSPDSDQGGSARARWLWVLSTLAMSCLVEVAAARAGRPQGVLRVTVLDVGQGDATLVDLPDGTLVLVDGGGVVGSPSDPGSRVILPLLRERRRERVDVAILSHPHPDHFLGLATVLRAVDVGELWDTGQGRAHGAGPDYAAMIRDLKARGVPIRGPETLCDVRSLGGASVQVMAPCPAFDPSLGANDNSFVIAIGRGDKRVLLMGDAEHEEEARLIRDRASELRADLLKVGHHGSRTSTSRELVELVRPRFATVSCGVRNRFGHPHAPPLETLEAAGVTTLRTDRRGSFEWMTDGEGVTARVFGESIRERLSAGLW